MSVLVIQLPPRDRLRARSAVADTAAAWRLPQEWSFVLSSDGRTVAQAGQAALTLMPRADSVVLMLAEADVGWHRVLIPRAPAARLRAALAGVMEESLLDDDEALHLALGPGAVAGRLRLEERVLEERSLLERRPGGGGGDVVVRRRERRSLMAAPL